MNKRLGLIAASINILSVATFAVSMLAGSNFVSYFSSIFIALSFVVMMAAFRHFADTDSAVAANAAMIFAGIYAAIILLVYFAQLTTVRLDSLSPELAQLLDYQKFGLFFNYNLLGYGLVALATFFAGLTIDAKSLSDRWLKRLFLIHGVFFISCLIIPLLGVFSQDTKSAWIGVAVLEFWCLYFIPVGILSYKYFKAQR